MVEIFLKDRFSRLDTIPAVTDSQPATQPRRRSIYRAKLLRRAGKNAVCIGMF